MKTFTSLTTALLLCAAAHAQSKGPVIINAPSEIPSPVSDLPWLTKKPVASPTDVEVDNTSNEQEIASYSKQKAQRKTSEILSNLGAIGKHCSVPDFYQSRVSQMKAGFAATVNQDLLATHFKHNLEFSLTLGQSKKNQGVAQACEPATYFIDTVSELSRDLNRALVFTAYCAPVFEAKKLKELTSGFTPLDKFTDLASIQGDFEAQEKNRLSFCNTNEEQNFKYKLVQSALAINTKLFAAENNAL